MSFPDKFCKYALLLFTTCPAIPNIRSLSAPVDFEDECKKDAFKILTKVDLSLQLNKPTVRVSEAFLMAYVKSVHDKHADGKISTITCHLTCLEKEFRSMFADLVAHEMPGWDNPAFSVDNNCLLVILREELVDLPAGVEIAAGHQVRVHKCDVAAETISKNFTAVSSSDKVLLIAFPALYLVEQSFSRVAQITAKDRNLLDIVESGNLTLSGFDTCRLDCDCRVVRFTLSLRYSSQIFFCCDV